jgi:hypothetical protein
MKDTFPALYGPVMMKMFEALGGPPHAVTMQSHLWDVTLMFHRSLHASVCNSPPRRKPFVESWAKNATDYVQIVREMIGPSPYLLWRTGNRRPTPSSERCKNHIMDEMNTASIQFTKELNVTRIDYTTVLNPPCRDTIHPNVAMTLNYMERLLQNIAEHVSEVSKTLEMFRRVK